MITCLIVDDEKDSRDFLSMVLGDLSETIHIVGQAKDIHEAGILIDRERPELVFLDIEMPGGTAFELLEKFDIPPFDPVFTTAHTGYALQAIKFCALDYLIKPFTPDEVNLAIKKFKEKRNLETVSRLHQLISNLQNPGNKKNRISLNTNESVEFIEVASIIRCEADGNYIKVYLTDSSNRLVVGKMKTFEEMLAPYGFQRVHHSHLINMDMISKFVKSGGGYLKLSNGEDIPVSRRKKDAILDQLNKW
ncbi:MAG: LytTR family DNA-binding domain-containing protein [Bacteroidota bacterium]